MLVSRFAIAAMIALPITFAPIAAKAVPITFSALGNNPAAIQSSVDAFRTALGALNPNVAGSFGSGRREINWDGVPDPRSAPNALPANFFNVNSPRGAVFSTPGTGFQVSATAASGTPVEFGNLDASSSAQFQTFSPQRLFTALGSNVLDVNFFVPGTTAAARTRGFGSVFTDVEIPDVTSLSFFDGNNALLDTFFVPVGPAGGLSFLGVDYGSAVVARVRVTSGNGVLELPESDNDLVVMDDFIYAEPLPEPGTMGLLVVGTLGLGMVTSRRRRTSERGRRRA